MKNGYLSQYFTGVASKYLSAVEANRNRSNQHEFNGVNGLREILGTERTTFQATFIYLCDDDAEPITETAWLTWYDARLKNPKRAAEYRLYFPGTAVSDNANEDDLLIIGKRSDNTLLVIIAESGSTIESQLQWLFGFNTAAHPGFSVKGEIESDQVKLEFASRFILEQIGIVVEETNENYLEQMLRNFNGGFPSTKIFSEFARSTISDLQPQDDADEVIMALMEREEVLFRTLERHLIGDRLQEGFHGNVDEFIKFSLSVQNRRKARAGHALENHLEHLFNARHILHTRGGVTEGKSKPDFLFPGQEQYHDSTFPITHLRVLGVKASCKDRWRQVLAEADRIPEKHLLTLEPGISLNQTMEMQDKLLQLVIPKALHNTYNSSQQAWLMNINEFVTHIIELQNTST